MLLRIGVYFLLFLNIGCQSTNLEDYHRQGRVAILDLAKDFHEINSLDDLLKRSSKLKKKMRRLTALMIEAENYNRKHPYEELKEKGNFFESDRLRYEMLRICEEIEGARAILEGIQDEMLDKLDLNDRRAKKL